MRIDGRSPRLAILIDADNTSGDHAHAIFDEIAKLGEANVRRIYGDFSGTRLKGWRDVMQPLAIVPQQQFNYTVGRQGLGQSFGSRQPSQSSCARFRFPKLWFHKIVQTH